LCDFAKKRYMLKKAPHAIAALGEFVREGYIGGVLRIEVDEEPLLVAALYNQNDSYMKTSCFADSGSLQHDIALAKRRSTAIKSRER